MARQSWTRMSFLLCYLLPLCFLLLLPPCGAIRKPMVTVTIDRGLPDTVTNVGQLFVYSLPPNAFGGSVREITVREATGESLPKWLFWDEHRRQLIGVPFDDAIGDLHLEVSAIGSPLNTTHTPRATDVFTIKIKEEFAGVKGGQADSFCSNDESTVTLGMLLDTELLTIPNERVGLVERAARLFSSDVNSLRLYRSAYEAELKRDLLLGGPGEQQSAKTAGVQLLWKIGCGRTLSDSLSVYVSRVERQITEGRVAATLRYPVVNWQVSTAKRSVLKRRRQLSAYYRDPYDPYNRRPYGPRPVNGESGGDSMHSTQDYVEGWWIRTTPTPRTVKSTTKVPTTTAAPRTRVTSRRTTRRSTIYAVSSKKRTTTPAPTEVTTAQVRKPGDQKPKVVNSLSSFVCFRGVVCHLRIPKETFFDAEDGDTYNLRLELSPIGATKTPWLFLDRRGRHVLGFSTTGGSWHYRLSATDSNGGTVSTAFVVQVVEASSEKPTQFNHQFTMVLQMDYERFAENATKQVHFLRRLGKALGDRDAKNIVVHSIEQGSTVITWSNKSLPVDDCLKSSINQIRRIMLYDNGDLRSKFQRSLGHEYKLERVTLQLKGACATAETTTDKSAVTPTKSGGEVAKPTETDKEKKDGGSSAMALDDDFLLSTLLPIGIILLLLLVAIICACVLYHKNKRHKLGATKDAKSEYVSKGLPVVFPEEVQADRELDAVTAATPMLIKEERAPLPPPADHEYRPSMTPTRGESAQPLMQDQHQRTPSTTEHDNPLYMPPPPMEMGNTRSPRPKHVLPHQREPPPYVPP